ncbi:ABC transporter permease [Phyllobacterium sp. 0TCS1.6C]|uniref:ABC transporter permease n=1 Tax=unclassified Phyllobacterium TaxID=2638441 RepID=UPI0022646C7B|nr:MULTISPECIES: ABC transporter permease [unclassified Phyllobacterium]MCX8279675.1 ABC transporter permease [Phyllobacterium sp. 0TCS1.6C]MCX8292134.1 ABC transporter permease [Phyllobacterium sp. 0TCS1.6A]
MLATAFTWIVEHQPEFYQALGQHLVMSGVSLAIALAIGLPLAVFIVNRSNFALVIINSVNALRTVPSLAILAIMMPLLGIGLWPSIVALTILALPPILLNAFVGLRDVDPDAVEAAVGMGMSRGQVLRKIRIPLAAPAMFAGARTAAVQVLAGATLAPFIGGGGLGDFIAVGISMMDMSRLLVGAVPIALLALATEFILGLAERIFFSERATA